MSHSGAPPNPRSAALEPAGIAPGTEPEGPRLPLAMGLAHGERSLAPGGRWGAGQGPQDTLWKSLAWGALGNRT